MFQLVGGYHCPFPLLSTLRATALGARPTWWLVATAVPLQFASQALQFYGAGWRALEFPVFRSISALADIHAAAAACRITFSGQQDSVCGIYGHSSSSGSARAGCFHGV